MSNRNYQRRLRSERTRLERLRRLLSSVLVDELSLDVSKIFVRIFENYKFYHTYTILLTNMYH